jgi:hypothetical protein
MSWSIVVYKIATHDMCLFKSEDTTCLKEFKPEHTTLLHCEYCRTSKTLMPVNFTALHFF